MVDDGSTDHSQEIYEKLTKTYPFSYKRHSSGPLGYGSTILTLFQESRENFDILITFDADLQHAPFSIKEIIVTCETYPEIDLVSTSRYLSYRFWKQNTKTPVDRYITNMLVTSTINKCFKLNLTDSFCGLKGYRTNKLPSNLDETGYAFPIVFWHYVSNNKLSIQEIDTPIIYRLDRRTRGEWKHRMREYYLRIESLVSLLEHKQLVRQDYEYGIERMTKMISYFNNHPIKIYQDFIDINWENEI